MSQNLTEKEELCISDLRKQQVLKYPFLYNYFNYNSHEMWDHPEYQSLFDKEKKNKKQVRSKN